MNTKNLNKNYECNFVDLDAMPLDTREGSEYDKRRNKPEYDNDTSSTLSPSDNDTYTLSPLDNNTSSLSPSGEQSISPFLSFPCLTRESRSHECRIESGRSMVEMLGVLAVIGVLSIGGIMGYSYGMDKYRANETINQIMLRAIDLMTQAAQGNETLTLAGWKNEPAQYDFSDPIYTADDLIKLDVGTASNPIPKRVCEQIFEGMKSNALYIDINGQEMDVDAECDANNVMTFYFEGGGSQMDVCNPACGENEYCDNGICFKGDKPEGTRMLDIECTTREDCNTEWTGTSCAHCNAIGKCTETATSVGKSCTLTDGNIAGLCSAGICIEKGCTASTPCKNINEYCASLNSSCDNRFVEDEQGICAKLDYKHFKIDDKIYYVSNTFMSWWDANASCQTLGKQLGKKMDLISVSELIEEWDGEDGEFRLSPLGNKFCYEVFSSQDPIIRTSDIFDSCNVYGVRCDTEGNTYVGVSLIPRNDNGNNVYQYGAVICR